MRRRDATDSLASSIQFVSWRTALAFVFALALHAALLTALSAAVLQVYQPERLIMVSMIAGGDGDRTTAPAADQAAPRVESRHRRARAKPAHEARAHSAAAAVIAAIEPTPASDVNASDATDGSAERGDGGSLVASVGSGDGSAGGNGVGNGVGHGSGSGEGDQRARCVRCPEPAYPLVARRHGWQGTVEVGLSLLPDGSVAAAAVRRSCGYEILDREAVAVARQSRFSPLVSAPVRGRIEYRFQLTASRP